MQNIERPLKTEKKNPRQQPRWKMSKAYEKCSVRFDISELQIKTTKRQHNTHIRMAPIQSADI